MERFGRGDYIRAPVPGRSVRDTGAPGRDGRDTSGGAGSVRRETARPNVVA